MITVRTYGFPGSFNEANPESSTRHIGKITLHVEADSPPCRSPESSGGAATLGGVQPQAYAPQRNERPAWRRGLGVLAALGVLVVKFAAKAKALLLLAPKLKLFTTSASDEERIAARSRELAPQMWQRLAAL